MSNSAEINAKATAFVTALFVIGMGVALIIASTKQSDRDDTPQPTRAPASATAPATARATVAATVPDGWVPRCEDAPLSPFHCVAVSESGGASYVGDEGQEWVPVVITDNRSQAAVRYYKVKVA